MNSVKEDESTKTGNTVCTADLMHRLTRASAPGPDHVRGPTRLEGGKKVMLNICVTLSYQGGVGSLSRKAKVIG